MDWQEERREEARAVITFWLLGIFSGIVVASLALLGLHEWNNTVKDVVTVLIGPVVSLLGSAIGFYFGTVAKARG